MKHFLLYGLGAAILFAVSANVSLWLQHKYQEGAVPEAAHTLGKIDKMMRQEATALSPNVQERENSLHEKEASLLKRQEKLELIQQDVRNERAALDDLRKQMQEQLRDAGTKATAAVVRLPEIANSRDDAARSDEKILAAASDGGHAHDSIAANDSGRANARAATLYENMPPEKAASLLQQMAAGSNPEDAVKFLAQMKEKTAELVLALVSSSDPKLSAQLRARMHSAHSAAVTVPVPPAPDPVPPSLPTAIPTVPSVIPPVPPSQWRSSGHGAD